MRFIFGIAAFILGFAVLLYFMAQMAQPPSAHHMWDGPELSYSEKQYQLKKVNDLIDKWSELGKENVDYKTGQPQTYTALIIDFNKKAMWIEINGNIQHPYYFELSPKITWSAEYQDLDGREKINSPIIAKYQGWYTAKKWPEMIYLFGQTPDGSHMNFHFNLSNHGSGFGSGLPTISPLQGNIDPEKEYYDSILISPADYEAYKQSIKENNTNQQLFISKEILENSREWNEIEPQIYREMEWLANGLGMELYRLEVEAGPDFHAAHALVRGHKSGISAIFSSNNSFYAFFKFDYLGDGIWYAKNWPHITQGFNRTEEFEMLITKEDNIPEDKEEWLKKGRKIQSAPLSVKTLFKHDLPNGATIEFIGICENPSAGKTWWYPDGSKREKEPFYNLREAMADRPDRNRFELVYRITNPPGTSGRQTSTSFEGSNGSGYISLEDRYGENIYGIECSINSFNKEQKTTTMHLCVTINDIESCVDLENISLELGQKTDFRFVETGKK